MIKKIQVLAPFLLLLLASTVDAQEAKINRAGEAYENYGYINARDIYLKVADKGFESEELFQRLANSYYFNANYDKALRWYEKLFALNKEQSEVYLRRYAQTLKATGNTKKASRTYNDFKESSASLLTAEDYSHLISENSGRYSIKKLNKVNTKGREFGHSFKDEKLIYAATRDTGVFVNRKNAWDGLAFLDLYQVEVTGDSVSGEPNKLKGAVNDKFHESSAVISADGNTLYFTKSNVDKKGKASQFLKIYRVQRDKDKWKDLEELSVNIAGYSSAHPALDPNEEYLYFASNRPGGHGESDLYRASISKDGSLGEAENLGPKVNTPGKETFPFISGEGELYFSSDGHFGLGGMDIFYIEIEGSGFGDLLNVGRPVNSYADDFSFGIDTQTKRGFFSSNRTEDKTFKNDNIYTLREQEAIKKLYSAVLFGKVVDFDTEEPIANATIQINEGDTQYKTIKTDDNGNYKTTLNYFKSYGIRAGKENYDTKEAFSQARIEEQEINFKLNRNTLALTPGTDISMVLQIKHILFDFDKSNIRSDARVELEKLLTVMQEYPDLHIAIRSHTDSRGNDTYNEKLSDRRAQSTRNYLIDKGIAASRLKAKGYGEKRLVNDCGNGAECSAAEHQRNRRSEFIVIDPEE